MVDNYNFFMLQAVNLEILFCIMVIYDNMQTYILVDEMHFYLLLPIIYNILRSPTYIR